MTTLGAVVVPSIQLAKQLGYNERPMSNATVEDEELHKGEPRKV